MTNEEAIRVIEVTKAECEWNAPLDYQTAFDVALKALEKQIPRKVIGEHYAHMRCPSCNHRIPSGLGSSSRRRDNWCNYCGQKILWSDEDD